MNLYPSRNSEPDIYSLRGSPRLERPQTPAAMGKFVPQGQCKKGPWKACSNPITVGHVFISGEQATWSQL